MANTFTIEVNVTDGGKTTKITRQVDALGSSVKRTKSALKDHEKAADDVFNRMDKGTIGVANSTRSFSKLAQTIGKDGSSGLVAAYATFAANVFAVSAAFNALRSAAQVEQVLRGLEAAGSRSGLALTTTARALKEVTGNAIDMEQAMRSTAQITSAGFSPDKVIKLGKAAKDASFALGRNMTDSLDRLTRGVVKLEPELLDELGVFTKLNDSNTQYASKLGKTATALSTTEKRTGFLNAVSAELEMKFGGLSDAAGDTQAYDQLASSFMNLRNQGLNTLNTFLKPVAALLASSPGALTGALVLFSASVASKMVPALANAASNSSKAAAAARDEATAIQERTTKIIAETKARRSNEFEAQKAAVGLGGKGPAKYKAAVTNIQTGAGTDADYAAAQASLTRSNATLERQARDTTKYTAEQIAAKRALINTQNQEIANLARLQALQKAVNVTEAENALIARETALAKAQSSLALSKEAEAAAIGAAANRSWGAAATQSIIATKEYAAALRELDAARSAGTNLPMPPSGLRAAWSALRAEMASLPSAALKAQVAMRGVAIAGKALGTAFLSAIPVIGQVFLALSILKMAWDAFKPESVKKLESAFDDFGEILGSTTKSVEGYKRAQESTASLAARTQQAVTIQSNAISTLTEAYNDLIKKQQLYNDSSVKTAKSGIASFGDVLGSFLTDDLRDLKNFRADKASYLTGIDKSSKALQAGMNKVGSIAFQDKAGIAAVQTLDQLTKLAPQATERLVEFAGGWDRLRKMDSREFANTVRAIADGVNSRYKDAADNVAALTDAFKNLNTSIGDWALASQQTTPFDNVVKNFQAVTNSITAFNNNAAKLNTIDASQWQGLLSGMGSNVDQMLTKGTSDGLQKLRASTDQLQLAEQAVKNTSAAGRREAEATLQVRKNQVATDTNILYTVQRELRGTQAKFELAQQVTREYKNQETLLQAHIAANQANYQGTAAGARARINAENRIKQLQIDEIKASVTLQKQYIEQASQALKANEIEEMRLATILKITGAISDQSLQWRLMYNEQSKQQTAQYLSQVSNGKGPSADQVLASPNTYLNDHNTTEQQKAAVRRLIELRDEKTTLDALVQTRAQDVALQQQQAAAQSAIRSAETQIAALSESQLTTSQREAEALKETTAATIAQLRSLSEQRAILNTIEDVEANINRLSEGRAENLLDQVNSLTRQARLSRQQLDDNIKITRLQYASDLASAKADRARATTSDDIAASNQRIGLLEEQNRIAEQGFTLQTALLERQNAAAILDKIQLDTQSTGLEIQQSALETLTRQVDVRKELVESAVKEAATTREIARRLSGRATTDDNKKIDEIEAARAAYRLAIDEASLKRATIKLEYALLDAQRQTQQNNLQMQRAMLVASGKFTEDQLSQIDSTLDTLRSSQAALQQGQAASLAMVNRNIEAARQQYMLSTLPEGRNSSIGDRLRDYRARRQAERAGFEDARKPAPVTTDVPVAIAPLTKISSDAVDQAKQQVAALTLLTTSIDSLRTSVDAQVNVKSSNQENTTFSRLNIRDAAAYATRNGFRVSEMEGYGGVHPVHKGAGHADGRAFDLNIGSGNVEANNPAMAKRMDELASYYRQQGYTVLWKVAGHFNHMHVEISKAAEAAFKRVDTAVATAAGASERRSEAVVPLAPSATVQQVAPVTPQIDPSDIVVTGKKLKKVDIASFLQITPIELDSLISMDKLEDAIRSKLQPFRSDVVSEFKIMSSDVLDTFKGMSDSLGPQGEIVPGLINSVNTIGGAFEDMMTRMQSHMDDNGNIVKASFGDKFQAAAAAAQTAVAVIQSAISNATSARVAAIDQEIAAEQRRDGKSAESVAKISALEKKKDAINRKQFNTNKKLMMAQAVISTAAGVAGALSAPFGLGIPLAIAIGALGAAQLAIIAGTSYQSTATTQAAAVETPSLSIGKRGDSVDLAKQNNNVGGELGYLRGRKGTGSNSSNYSVVGSAYGGDLPRGYGNTAYVVGEKGPETITAQTAITVRPANDNHSSAPINANFTIHAIDASGVEDVLRNQKGNLISMFRDAANANGQPFLESVNTATLSRPNKTAGSRL